jgi:hypothetical protein
VLDEKNIIDLSLVDKFVMKVFVRVYQSDRHKPFIALLINKKGKFKIKVYLILIYMYVVHTACQLPVSAMQRKGGVGWPGRDYCIPPAHQSVL